MAFPKNMETVQATLSVQNYKSAHTYNKYLPTHYYNIHALISDPSYYKMLQFRIQNW